MPMNCPAESVGSGLLVFYGLDPDTHTSSNGWISIYVYVWTRGWAKK